MSHVNNDVVKEIRSLKVQIIALKQQVASLKTRIEELEESYEEDGSMTPEQEYKFMQDEMYYK